MAILDKLFGNARQRDALAPLYAAIIAKAREPHWYAHGGVPDTTDGRFDMVAAILSLVLLRLEDEGETHASESTLLAEVFIDDMDGQLREIGVGDVIVGKHVGKMMGALGGRIGAYRAGVAPDGSLEDALERNLYRGEKPDSNALAHTESRLRAFRKALSAESSQAIIAGRLPE